MNDFLLSIENDIAFLHSFCEVAGLPSAKVAVARKYPDEPYHNDLEYFIHLQKVDGDFNNLISVISVKGHTLPKDFLTRLAQSMNSPVAYPDDSNSDPYQYLLYSTTGRVHRILMNPDKMERNIYELESYAPKYTEH